MYDRQRKMIATPYPWARQLSPPLTVTWIVAESDDALFVEKLTKVLATIFEGHMQHVYGMDGNPELTVSQPTHLLTKKDLGPFGYGALVFTKDIEYDLNSIEAIYRAVSGRNASNYATSIEGYPHKASVVFDSFPPYWPHCVVLCDRKSLGAIDSLLGLRWVGDMRDALKDLGYFDWMGFD